MSRIGKKPIEIVQNVDMQVNGNTVSVSGPKGKIEIVLPDAITLKVEGKIINILTSEKSDMSLQGLFRSQIYNAVYGVSNGWQKVLELVGVGYRAQTTGSELVLSLGFSHPVKIQAPQGVTFSVNENKIIVSGADKYLVGEICAKIRRLKPPEPYKGKGIRYQGEIIRKKLGKAAKAVGGATGGK
jgi:large subunit ribosomal protein L6